MVSVVREEDDLFADPSFEVTRSSYDVQATALLDSPIDPAVVQRLVQQRLGQAATLALTDLLRAHATRAEVGRPTEDMVLALQALIVPASDGETRTQGLLAALLRNGLAFGLHRLLEEAGGLVSDCSDRGLQLTAVYEGLAASRYLRPVGFPSARGTVDSRCQQLASRVAQLVDTVAVLGADGQSLADTARSLNDVRRACNDAARRALPLEVTSALVQLGTADRWELSLADVRRLSLAFLRHRATLASSQGVNNKDLHDCFQKLDVFTQRFGGDLETLGSQVPGLRASLGALLTQVEQTRELFPKWLANPNDLERALVDARASLKAWTLYVLKANAARTQCAGLMNGGTSLSEFVRYASLDASSQPDTCKAAFTEFLEQHRAVAMPVLANVPAPSLSQDLNGMEALLEKHASWGNMPPELRARMQVLRGILRSVARNRQLRRDDVIQLAHFAESQLLPASGQADGLEHKVLRAFFSSLPEAIREDASTASGVRLDTPTLATRMASTYVDDKRTGWYLRATVGTGYLTSREKRDSLPYARVTPTVFEEVGVGWRFGKDKNFLMGPHLIASGLLFQFMPGGQRQRVFTALGWSFNIYRLVDVSVSAGRLIDTEGAPGVGTWAGAVSLQLPLSDYFAALADDRGTTTTTSVPAATTP
jgi:hypothetical protein